MNENVLVYDGRPIFFHNAADKLRFEAMPENVQRKLVRRSQNKPGTSILDSIAHATTEEHLDAIADRMDKAAGMSEKARRKANAALAKRAEEIEHGQQQKSEAPAQ